MSTIRVSTFEGPGARAKMQEVPRPKVPDKAALIRIGVCGVCGTDLHILRGHWPKPLPWPFTLGHELAGVIVGKGPALEADFMGWPLTVGSKVMLPPLMPRGECDYCVHYPANANKCLNPTYLRPLPGIREAPAPVGRLGGDGVRRPRHAPGDEGLPPAR